MKPRIQGTVLRQAQAHTQREKPAYVLAAIYEARLNHQKDLIYIMYLSFSQFERLGRVYWGQHVWARGYCVGTVGLNEELIRKYVRWQERGEKENENVPRRLFDFACPHTPTLASGIRAIKQT